MTTGLLAVGWLLVAVVLGLLVGGGIRIADEREGHRPARLDPRAGVRTSRAAHATFTVLVAGLVVIAVGAAQDAFGVLA